MIIFLTSCSSKMGSDFSSQAAAELEKVPDWSTLSAAPPASTLFSLIDSTELERLVDQALTANPGLEQTRLSLAVLQAELRQTKGSKAVQVSADLSGGKEKDDPKSYSASMTISWTADIWGKLADEIAGVEMDVAEQTWLHRSAQNSLAGEVMKVWLQIVSASHGIDIEERRLTTLLQNEQYILERYRNGLGPLENLDSARSNTASAKATLAEYKEKRNRLQRLLQTLLGSAATLYFEVPENYPAVLTPLADLPPQSLSRRPDLKAAYYAVVSAEYKSSVAYKELLPSIDLSATLNDMGDSPSSLLLSDPVWSLLGQLAAPLFRGGSLKAAAEAAELRAARSYQAYRETLLGAVQEVEDALGYERELEERIRYIETSLNSAENSLQAYQKSYRAGLVDILDLLSVQERVYDLEIQLDNLIHEQLANRITLGLALGLGVT